MKRSVLVMLVTLICLASLPVLQSESDLSSALSERDKAQLENEGFSDRPVALLVRSDNLAQAPTFNALSDLLFELQLREGVTRVTSIFSLPDVQTGQLVLEQALAGGDEPRTALERSRRDAHFGASFLSEDLTATLIFVSGDNASLSSLAQSFGRCAEDSSLCVTAIGPIAIEQATEDRLEFDNLLLTPISALVCLTVVAVWFGSLRVAVHVIAPVLVGVVWYFGVLALLGIPVDVFNALVPTVILTIGLADMLHLLNAVGKSHSASTGFDLRLALRQILPAISLTTSTTMFAFATLAIEGSVALQRLAFCGVAGASLLWLAIVLIGPSACRAVAPLARDRGSVGRSVSSTMLRSIWASLRFRGWIIGGSTAFILAGLISLIFVPADFEFTENLPRGPIAEAFETAERAGLAMAPMLVSLPAAPREDLRKALTSLYEGAAPGADDLSDAIAGRDTLVVPIPVTAGLRASEILTLAEMTRTRLAQHPEARVNGFPVRVSSAVIEVVERLQMVFLFAITVLALVFGVIFRSVRLAVCALFINSLPLLAMHVAMTVTMGWINMASVVAMIVASGIVVDDTVHLLWAIRREQRSTFALSMMAGLRHSIEPVSLTSLALICGFAVSLASGLPGLQIFGALVMVSLCLAWLADVFLLPAVLVRNEDVR